jgi:5,10-methylenetetrahydromethanopterin reductase
VGTFAHFSGMAGSSADGQAPADRRVFEQIHAHYERGRHTLASSRHARELDDAFLDRFAVVGPPASCVERLRALLDCGLRRLVVTSASMDSDRDQAQRSHRLFVEEVLPALQGR